MKTTFIKNQEQLNELLTNGDLIIDGNLESGIPVKIAGNIRINGYIRTKISVRAGGSIGARNFIEVGSYIGAGGYIEAGGSVEAGSSVEAGGSVRAGGFIEVGSYIGAGGYIEAGGSIEAGLHVHSMKYEIKCKKLITRTLPYGRDYYVAFLPQHEDIIMNGCWDKIREELNSHAVEIAGMSCWHPIIRAQIRMFFGLSKEEVLPETKE